MWNPPDVWIRLRALPNAAPIDQQKQAALQNAFAAFLQIGLHIRHGEMSNWSHSLGQPDGWPLVPVDETALLLWEPIGVVISEAALCSASEQQAGEWKLRMNFAVGLLLDAGLSVAAMAPGANRVIGSIAEFEEWCEFVINPASRRGALVCALSA
jgi:hypothetical protein